MHARLRERVKGLETALFQVQNAAIDLAAQRDDAVVREREACALVAESFDVRVVDPLGRVHIVTSGLETIAAAIRERSK